MSRTGKGFLTVLFSCAAFYVIFAAGCAFVQGRGDTVSIAVTSLSEICAAFGGACTLRYLSSRLLDSVEGTESELAASDGEQVGVRDETFRLTSAVRIAVSGIVCAAVLFFGNLLYSRYIYGSSEAPSADPAVSVIFLGLLVPLAEEIFFRGCIKPHLEDSGFSATVSILVSSAAFALIHSPGVMPFAFFAGICLGICARERGKRGIASSFTAHAVYNTSLCILAAIQTQ